MNTPQTPETVAPAGHVVLRGKVWEIVDVVWCGPDRSVGIMSDYVDEYNLEDENGARWDWDKDQLTEEEDKLVNEVLCKLERDYDEPEDWI